MIRRTLTGHVVRCDWATCTTTAHIPRGRLSTDLGWAVVRESRHQWADYCPTHARVDRWTVGLMGALIVAAIVVCVWALTW